MLNLKKGDILGISHYYKVKDITKDNFEITDLHGKNNFIVDKEGLINFDSASHYENVERLPKTQIAEKLLKAETKPFTVHFLKKDGEERTLVGRYKSHDMLGYAHVEDFEHSCEERRVNLRDLEWLILDKVKYVLK